LDVVVDFYTRNLSKKEAAEEEAAAPVAAGGGGSTGTGGPFFLSTFSIISLF
jgi:hypothetical protein